MKKEKPIKPNKPIEPNPKDYIAEGERISNGNFVIAYNKYTKALEKYKEELFVYEQLKMIRLIKVADEKLILKKFKIISYVGS